MKVLIENRGKSDIPFTELRTNRSMTLVPGAKKILDVVNKQDIVSYSKVWAHEGLFIKVLQENKVETVEEPKQVKKAPSKRRVVLNLK